MLRNLTTCLVPAALASALALTAFAGNQETCPTAAAKSECATAKSECAATPCDSATKTTSKQSDKLMKVTYQVAGMTCVSCENKLTQALTSVKGVSEASACVNSKVAKIAYDPAAVKDSQLFAAIKKAGYQVETGTVAFQVTGLSCGACTDKLGKSLTAVKGVREQKVCLESKLATVKFDPNQVSLDKVLAAVDASGFKVAQ